ncbi:DUF7522 family protein [Haloarcula rara]
MYEVPFETDIDSKSADSVISAARESLGDTLRSVVYFTPSGMDLLYVRQDPTNRASGPSRPSPCSSSTSVSALPKRPFGPR